jgi:hypothetical protein
MDLAQNNEQEKQMLLQAIQMIDAGDLEGAKAILTQAIQAEDQETAEQAEPSLKEKFQKAMGAEQA